MEASFTIAVLVLLVAGTAFWLWALADVFRRSDDFRTGTKELWAVVIALTHFFGALAYVALGRPKTA